MVDKFILDFKNKFNNHYFSEKILTNKDLFVFETSEINNDNKRIKYTKLSAEMPANRHFKINNNQINNPIAHICIDGDFIEYGNEKYDNLSEKFSQGRPDSIVFDNAKFLFLELKLEQEDLTWTKEDAKWKLFFEGAKQILDFVIFLKNNLFEISEYYSTIFAVVCMRFEPDFSTISRGNSARNTEIFKISQKLGFEIKAHNHTEDYTF